MGGRLDRGDGWPRPVRCSGSANRLGGGQGEALVPRAGAQLPPGPPASAQTVRVLGAEEPAGASGSLPPCRSHRDEQDHRADPDEDPQHGQGRSAAGWHPSPCSDERTTSARLTTSPAADSADPRCRPPLLLAGDQAVAHLHPPGGRAAPRGPRGRRPSGSGRRSCTRSNTASTSSGERESRLPVGSSASISDGAVTRARRGPPARLATESSWPVPGVVGEPHHVHRGDGALATFAPRHLRICHRQLHVGHARTSEERGRTPGRRSRSCGCGSGPGAVVQAPHVQPVEQIVHPLVGTVQAAQHVHQRRLPRPGGPHHREVLPRSAPASPTPRNACTAASPVPYVFVTPPTSSTGRPGRTAPRGTMAPRPRRGGRPARLLRGCRRQGIHRRGIPPAGKPTGGEAAVAAARTNPSAPTHW